MVNYRPQDLFAAGTLVAIIQKPAELPPGSNQRLVLIDVVFHEHRVADSYAHGNATPLRRDMTRRLLLEDLGLQPYCATVEQ